MDCPTCQSPMTQGEISLEVTWADLVMGSGGASVLRFHEPHKEPFTIMREPESLPGLNCQTCGSFVVITDFAFTETECLICHAKMPPGLTSCAQCGWTYEARATR